jgi:hypothetical protein
LIAVTYNLIARGLPTRLSAFLTEKILGAFAGMKIEEELGHVRFETDISESEVMLIYRALQ